MKSTTYKYIAILGIILLIISCSTKKDKFLNRTYNAKTAKYNILYNGGIALDAGLIDVENNYKDNFWEILPIERMQVQEEDLLPDEKKDPNFERAEDKSVKAIQKHSMNIGGAEKNKQMDEAHILLGKSRYYQSRFIPALEAFNYVLYKYPNSDKIYDAKVWREKVNIRLENEQIAIENLKKLLNNQKIEGQDLANANAILAQAYISLGVQDSALMVLKIAKEITKINTEKARYSFIIGQLYEALNQPDSAAIAYHEVIDMKRKAPRKYTMQSHARLAQQFDYEKGDTLAFMEKFNNLLEDRENRPFLDILNHQVGLFYDKQQNDKEAVKYYNKSLRKQTADQYLTASNYRNIAEIYFNNAKYETAGKYYDSTLAKLEDKTREFKAITKKRLNLVDVIKYEAISRNNDSILYVVSLSDEEKEAYYSSYIDKLKEADIIKQKEAERLALIEENKSKESNYSDEKAMGMPPSMKDESGFSKNNRSSLSPPTDFDVVPSNFYFYNIGNIASGKREFQKKWGKRPLQDNWRLNKSSTNNSNEEETETENSITTKEVLDKPEYKATFYTSQLPTAQKALDSIKKDRDFADFQLGSIYKEKFKEYKLAASKLEKLLGNNPEERLILPSKYNLFKIYQIIGSPKEAIMKQEIIAEFPNSRYAQIIQNPNQESQGEQSPENVYANLYRELESGNIQESYQKVNEFIDVYTGDEIAPKFELLKAQIVARLKGLDEYKKVLNFVALNYPNTQEGKKAEEILTKDIPNLEKLDFTKDSNSTWNIMYPKNNLASNETEALIKKLDQYIKDRNDATVKISTDFYTEDTNFVVIHGFSSKEIAQSTISLLSEYKDYKIKDEAVAISSDDYTVVQIKKNWNTYLELIK